MIQFLVWFITWENSQKNWVFESKSKYFILIQYKTQQSGFTEDYRNQIMQRSWHFEQIGQLFNIFKKGTWMINWSSKIMIDLLPIN